MAITWEVIRAFATRLIEAEYDAQYHKLGSPTNDVLIPKLKLYGEMFDKGVKTRIASISGGDESERSSLTRRKIFGYALFDHPTHGEAWAIYVSGARDYSDTSLDYIYYVVELDGAPKIVTKQGVDSDGDAASIRSTDGAPAPSTKQAKRVEITSRPSHPGEAKLLPK